MISIEARNVGVDFPILNSSGQRSIKKRLINIATGGVLAADAGDRVVVRALDGVSFRFVEGDRVGVVGHNGSGKTTLLQTIAGVYEPTAGELDVEGRVSSLLGISLGMEGEITGRENIYLRARLMGCSRTHTDHLIDEIAEFSGLGDFLDLPLRTYSTGMAMRLAFSVATSVEAEIILMDEWLSVGDADFSVRANARLTRMVDRAALVVIASHDRALLDEHCNVILTLAHGKLLSIASVVPGRVARGSPESTVPTSRTGRAP